MEAIKRDNPPLKSAKKYTAVVFITYACVFLLNIFNSTALNMLLQYLSTDVQFAGTVLPHIVYYLMSVLAIVWQFVGVAAICDCISREHKLLTAASAVLFFCAMMASSFLPIIVAAVQYSSQTLGTLIYSNSAALLTDGIFGAVRVMLVTVICLAVCAYCRRKQKNRLSAALLGCLWCAMALTALSMAVIFFYNTLPFLQSAGRNALQSQLPKILLEYVILALYGVIGYAVGALYIRAVK